jgi:hypothetical protein
MVFHALSLIMTNINVPTFAVPKPGDAGGSPRGDYTYFLLAQCARHQWIMSSTPEDGYINIRNSCLSLVSFCPDEQKRDELFKLYKAKEEEYGGDVVSTSLFVVGKMVDYLNEALEFTEKDYGMVI